GALLLKMIAGEIAPTPALAKPPMLPTSQNMPTNREPMKSIIAEAHGIEAHPSVLNVTVAGGFPPADVAEAGFGVIVTTNNDAALARRYADELAHFAWNRREEFLGGVASWEEAIRALQAIDHGPLVLVDI